MTVTYGTTLPQREFENELESIKEFVLGVESLGLSYLRVTDQVIVLNRGGFLRASNAFVLFGSNQ